MVAKASTAALYQAQHQPGDRHRSEVYAYWTELHVRRLDGGNGIGHSSVSTATSKPLLEPSSGSKNHHEYSRIEGIISEARDDDGSFKIYVQQVQQLF